MKELELVLNSYLLSSTLLELIHKLPSIIHHGLIHFLALLFL